MVVFMKVNGKTIKATVTVNIISHKELITLDIGKTIFDEVKDLKNGKMVVVMMDSILMIKSTTLGFMFGVTNQSSLVNGKRIKYLALAYAFMLMDEHTRVNGRTITWMVLAYLNGLMVESSLECIRMINNHGFGVYYWADGSRYEGLWSNGLQHGIGKYFKLCKDGYKIGVWKEGKRKIWVEGESIENLVDKYFQGGVLLHNNE